MRPTISGVKLSATDDPGERASQWIPTHLGNAKIWTLFHLGVVNVTGT